MCRSLVCVRNWAHPGPASKRCGVSATGFENNRPQLRQPVSASFPPALEIAGTGTTTDLLQKRPCETFVFSGRSSPPVSASPSSRCCWPPGWRPPLAAIFISVSYTHLRAHETDSYLVCRLLLEKKKKNQ